MNTISQLRQEHAGLVKVLNEIKQKGIGTQDGKQVLFAAKEGLLAHLQHEDKELYGPLYRAAEKDEKLKMTLANFADDMKKISAEVMAFFDKYSGESVGLEFATNFGRIYSQLQQRIMREEKILFPAFEKLAK